MSHGRFERGLFELYGEDPLGADERTWGRRSDLATRRGFLRSAGISALGVAIGLNIPFSGRMPAGLIPAAFAATNESFAIEGKEPGLVILNDRPLNAETPPHLLNDLVTPASRLFVRNNGIPPVAITPAEWILEIGGESIQQKRSFSVADLRREFPSYRYQLQIECGGNGRAEYRPRARGNQWTTGAIGCPEWTGVRLKDVLSSCGIREDAVYIGYLGADLHASGNPDKVVISRGVPIKKALEDETLIAFAMNGEAIPALHGAPLRLVCGGWPGSVSGKWLRRIDVRDRVHDGAKMTGKAYRVPCNPVAPGQSVPDADMCIIESMPVKSLVTSLPSGAVHPLGAPLSVGGFAWAGDQVVDSVHVSIDFGQTWTRANLSDPANRLAWQQWKSTVHFPQRGYFEVWARATDDRGRQQPMIVPGWNPKGYLNNACHRVAIRVV